MKTFFTLFTSLLLSISLLANNGRAKSVVTVKSMDNSDIRVVMNGKRFEPNHNSLVINNVNAGRHTIKVYKQSRTGLFNIVGRRYELVYSSQVQIKNRTQLFITIERNGFVNVAEDRMQNRNVRLQDRNNRDFDFDRDGQFGDYDTRYGYEAGMNAAEFNRVLRTIDAEWFEGNKIKSATHIVRSHRLSTAQVMEIMRLFTFENNRLELAKLAYTNTVDKWNYREVYSLFSFQASKTELERYIRK